MAIITAMWLRFPVSVSSRGASYRSTAPSRTEHKDVHVKTAQQRQSTEKTLKIHNNS